MKVKVKMKAKVKVKMKAKMKVKKPPPFESMLPLLGIIGLEFQIQFFRIDRDGCGRFVTGRHGMGMLVAAVMDAGQG